MRSERIPPPRRKDDKTARRKRSRKTQSYPKLLKWLVLGVVGVIVILLSWWLGRPKLAKDDAPVSLAVPIVETSVSVGYGHVQAGFRDLETYMIELINADRTAHGLSPVLVDRFAADVGRQHAVEMAATGYLSHWNQMGYGPDIRYGLAGGTDVVMENVFSYYLRYDDGTPAEIEDWPTLIKEAQQGFMDSPGHRDNILKPEHTHVGVGIAYDPTTSEVRIAQEFINKYVEIDQTSTQITANEVFELSGQLLAVADELVINVAYEPYPKPLRVSDLEKTSTYTSPAEIVDALGVEMLEGGEFSAEIDFEDYSHAGIYHVLLWLLIEETPIHGGSLLLVRTE